MGVEGLGAVAVVKAVVRTVAQSSVLLLVTCSCVCVKDVCVCWMCMAHTVAYSTHGLQ